MEVVEGGEGLLLLCLCHHVSRRCQALAGSPSAISLVVLFGVRAA